MSRPGQAEAEALLRHRDEHRAEADAAEARADFLGNLRIGLVLLGLGLLLLPLVTRDGTPWWLLVPDFVLFMVLGVFQDRASRREQEARARQHYMEAGRARWEESWRALEDDGAELAPEESALATDLDLYGPASLFQLLNRARTAVGRRTLAGWLLEPPSVEETQARQRAVQVLAPRLDFRADLWAASAGTGRLDVSEVQDWARTERPLPAEGGLKLVGLLFPCLTISTFILFQLGAPAWPFGVMALIHLVTLGLLGGVVGPKAALLAGPERTLRRASKLIRLVEAQSFGVPWLDARRDHLVGPKASLELGRLERLVNLLDARLNVVFALSFGVLLMWDLNLVLRAEDWRRRNGRAIEGWLQAVADVECAASLAALAHERPDYGFLELVEHPGVFEAEALQHPLIDRRNVVSNELGLGGPGSILLLSGSNMSGKSTLLRSVGLALVMGRAGAPVGAHGLRASPFELGTSVRVVDSLAKSTSHFYAELQRLKAIVDAGGRSGTGLLYLLDEVLHGTNSQERTIGAIGVMRWLSEQGALGVVTTHDLALAEVAKELPEGRCTQAHFSDRVDGDGIAFDYRLQDGPIASTNALRLMRHVGIDVPMGGS
ncbi:MAG: hypothetical protein AAGJ19_06865 [Myxococcota bacterium]